MNYEEKSGEAISKTKNTNILFNEENKNERKIRIFQKKKGN